MPRTGGYEYGMSHKSYWTQRSKEQLSETFATADKVEKYIRDTYKRNLIKICNKYSKLIKPFIKDGELDVAEFQKAKAIDKKFADSLTRLETEIGAIKKELGSAQIKQVTSLLEKAYKFNVIKTYDAFGASTDSLYLLNKKAIRAAITQPFTKDGREFSDRIWKNLDIMEKNLRRELADSITEGRSIQKTVRNFKKIMGNTTYNTSRIIRTETIAVYAKASRDTYASLGVKEMEILAEHDACDVCGEMNGNKIDVDSAEIGLDIPPFHPNCRCCVIPVVNW